MPRTARFAPGGYVYHAINRGVARLPLFDQDGDYEAFERVPVQAHDRVPIRILGYCLMPNHGHFVLWPAATGELTEFLRWLTHPHTQRWHAHRRTTGTGHLYQGRFKAFPVQEDAHLLTLCARARDWPWSSLAHRLSTGDDPIRGRLSPWPVRMPADWPSRVDRPQTEKELEAVRRSVSRGQPFGDEAWQLRTAKALRLESTFRERGRPRKAAGPDEGANDGEKVRVPFFCPFGNSKR